MEDSIFTISCYECSNESLIKINKQDRIMAKDFTIKSSPYDSELLIRCDKCGEEIIGEG